MSEAARNLDALEDLDPVAFETAFVFLILLLYHRRGRQEADELIEAVAEVRPAARKETIEMGKTYAKELLEEGEVRGEARGEARGRVLAKQESLLTLLTARFGAVPESVVQRVQSLADPEALDAFIRRFVGADSLDAMGL